ncbi:MAG: terminase family protein [Sphingomicrobium sp.]
MPERNRWDGASHIHRLMMGRSEAGQRRIIAHMSALEALMFDADFEMWAHDGQLPPDAEGWTTWLMMAGRGFGKTRAGAEWIHKLATQRSGLRIALVGATMHDARRVMIEGVSGLLTIAHRHQRSVRWEPSLGRFNWPNGSEAQIFSGDNADGLRGPEHDFAWADELAKWGQADDAWMNLRMGLRRGRRARALVTTTPRAGGRLLAQIRDDPWTVTTGGRTADNVNLDEKFIDVMTATYGGTRMGRQELDGELISEVEGALWSTELIERSRIGSGQRTYDRIYVGVDPPAGAGPDCDACGIVVVGRCGEELHVLADETVRGLSPDGWASQVARVVARWKVGLVIAEANQGGAMVESVLKAADSGLKVRLVHASRGKSARAEPIALRFEKGTAKLAGVFPELEAELKGLVAGGGYEGPGRSPDRADAMVWAMTALGESRSGVPRVRML